MADVMAAEWRWLGAVGPGCASLLSRALVGREVPPETLRSWCRWCVTLALRAFAPLRSAVSVLSRRDPMVLSNLSGDEQGIILGQLRNTLEPRLVMYFSSANKELRALLPLAAQQQLRTDY